MIYLYASLLTLLNAVWLATVVLGLPGTWLIVLTTAGLAWWQRDAGMIGIAPLVALVALAVVGEVVEFLAGVWGTKRFGGGNRAAIGAMVGTLVGGLIGTFVIPVPFFNSLIGACGGALLGALTVELSGGGPWRASINAGVGAGLGRLGGTLGKLIAGAAMWVVATAAAFF